MPTRQVSLIADAESPHIPDVTNGAPAKCVDVVINVYGKPWQTAVTLLSLLKHSSRWIDTVYFIEERKQPEAPNFDWLLDRVRREARVIRHKPSFFFWVNPSTKLRPFLWWRALRQSIRYQFAWEKTDKKYLFITHNDVLYTADLVGRYLDQIGSHIGIGEVGACWNCPAYGEAACKPDHYTQYRPTRDQFQSLLAGFKSPRGNSVYESRLRSDSFWPLPECRINEWACLINMEIARPVTMPVGKCVPFGSMFVDIGAEWFYQTHLLGHTARHAPIKGYARHSWANPKNNGHSALFDKDLYAASEQTARQLIEKEFV